MNSERLHTTSVVPEFSDLTNEQLEQLRDKITEELGRRTIEAIKLVKEMEAKSDKDYEATVEKANMGDAESQKELTDYQRAKSELAKADAKENELLQQGLDNLPDNVLNETVAEFDANAKEAAAAEDVAEIENGVAEAEAGAEAEAEAEPAAGMKLEGIELPGAPIVSFDKWASGKIEVEEPKAAEEAAEGAVEAAEIEKEEAELEDKMDEIINQKVDEIIEQLKEGEVSKAEEKLEKEFEQEAKKDKKRGEKMLKFFRKHPRLAKVAVVAIMAAASIGGLTALVLSNFQPTEQSSKQVEADAGETVAKAATKGGDGIYNEWAASRYSSSAEKSDAKIEDSAEANAEKISSTAKFKIDGKDFTYENKEHDGGYNKEQDSFYDDDKDGIHSMMGPAYKDEWKGTESAFESYEGLMSAMKGSPEMASMIAMAAGIPGAENIHSQSALNDFADELRNKSPEGFDKFMTAASDYINNFVNGGQMKVDVISAGDHYQSTYSYGTEGNLEIGVDKDVSHNFDVQVVDFLDADGNSMFNSDEAKARIREMFGLSKKANFTAGWSARCGQIVIQLIVSNPTPDKDIDDPTPDKDTDDPTPDKDTDDPTPEDTPKPTPTPEDTPDPTPEDTPDPTPDETPNPDETLTPKGPDAHAGDNQQQMGTTETNNDDTKVTADERGNVDPNEAPGSAVEGMNTEGVNTETVNPGGLNQTETTPAPNEANENSRTENMQHGGDAQSLADRMQQAEQAERNS